MGLEEGSEVSGEVRVKFQVEISDTCPPPFQEEWIPLAAALTVSEELGAAPATPSGLVCGNGAILSSNDNGKLSIVVSKSGRVAGPKLSKADFVRVLQFDSTAWKATYGGCGESTSKPSSDTPLLWNALVVAPQKFHWTLKPQFILHGHSCASQEDADRLNVPCSPTETLFSTPADLNALMDLLEQHPYPKHQIFIRKNHGFFLLAQDQDEACRIFREVLAPQAATTISLSLDI
ncbi:Importin-beta N-terminal domain [Seminavis robusta]|uniref:Importin-beta N-terminal domain n=1 Tax=Seminavis robusta TaxID=568900 RepID=A0A9N8E0Y6_9STRA|nr:Importin-beta N-terminal domain [Seminavis robusta]|eukprot:Sro439_g143160.1 Importin-beta N-terminal domain (234) ;mRNA; f:20990-21691